MDRSGKINDTVVMAENPMDIWGTRGRFSLLDIDHRTPALKLGPHPYLEGRFLVDQCEQGHAPKD